MLSEAYEQHMNDKLEMAIRKTIVNPIEFEGQKKKKEFLNKAELNQRG